MNALVVEDDDASRVILAAQLQQSDWTVLQAEDGAAGWELYQREHPSLVITDWKMPRMDGIELCQRIRALHHPEYSYIMILTAVDKKAGYLEGMKAGADDFVNKPVEFSELRVRLRVARRILALQKERQHLEGLLPICPRCKKIRTDTAQWVPVESYLSNKTEAQFSHGICPECYAKIVQPQLDALRRRNQAQRQ